jgi:hypothetical protein
MMASGSISNELTLITYSTGTILVREVLGDWLSFLGERPKDIVVAVSPATGYPAIYDQLRAERIIDRILPVDGTGRSIHQTDPTAIRTAVESATSEWVMLVKLDTLPFRVGHASWLHDDLQTVHERKLFGITGSFRSTDAKPVDTTYSSTQCYSNNFSVFRKADWLAAVDRLIGPEWDQPLANDPRYQGDGARFAVEAAIEQHLRESGLSMLVRRETPEWSVFHVNVWGDTLRGVRERYLRRDGIGAYLNTGEPLAKPHRHPWEMYYGTPVPPLWKRLRIRLGEWRRGIA